MPIYEYRCRTCGQTTEELRSLGRADDVAVCACGADDTVRMPSLVARRSGAAAGLPIAGGAAPQGGGCCGGGCCG
jgi:putative FmdB family regulatory protein